MIIDASYVERQNAIRDLDALIKENPQTGKLYYLKGYYYFQMNLRDDDWQTVAGWFDTAIKYGYENLNVHYYKGLVLALAYQDEEAICSFNKVLKIMPGHAPALYEKGRILMYDLRHDDALVCFNKIEQKNAAIYTMMGELYLDKNMDDKSEQYLSTALSMPDIDDASNASQFLKRIQRRKKYRKEKAYNKGVKKELEHLKLDQWFSKQRRIDLIKWFDQLKSTSAGSSANLDRLYEKIKGRCEPNKGGSGLFLQAELTRTLWGSTCFSVTNVERGYKIDKVRNIDIDIELNSNFCIQVWSAVSTTGLIMLGESDNDTKILNIQKNLTTKFGGIGRDQDRDWIGLEDKINQLPDDRPGFVVVGYPIWITFFRYQIQPKYCQGIPTNKCVIVLDIDLETTGLAGHSILYYHPQCTCVNTAEVISREMGFEPSAYNSIISYL